MRFARFTLLTACALSVVACHDKDKEKKAIEIFADDSFKAELASASHRKDAEQASEKAAPGKRVKTKSGVRYRVSDDARRRVAEYLTYYPSNKLLHQAVGSGDAEMLVVLLEGGADPNYLDQDRNTQLMCAASKGSLQMVKILIDFGANVNQKRFTGDTALWAAASSGHKEVVDFLLKHGAKIDAKPTSFQYPTSLLGEAAHGGCADLVRKVIEAGADIEWRSSPNADTALMIAVKSGSIETVQVLLDKGAKTDVKDSSNQTLLDLARTPEMREYLKSKGIK